MSHVRWCSYARPPLPAILAALALVIALLPGCGRSTGAPEASKAPAAAQAAEPDEDDAAAKAIGGLVGRMVDDATAGPREARGAPPDAQELTPPPGLDLSRAPAIPLVEGLTIVTAIAEAAGDYESVKRVASMDAERIRVSYSATRKGGGDGWKEVTAARIVRREDLQTGRTYRMVFTSGQTQTFKDATAVGVSAAVLDELRGVGRAECALGALDTGDAILGAVGLPSPEYDVMLERVGEGRVAVPVLVDGERQWLPAIHAKGVIEALSGDTDAEFWFLDDPANALTLRAVIGGNRLVAIRIDRPRVVASRLEATLAAEDRVELPGIYFEFASAALRPESDATIAEVAALLRRHPDWRIRFDGHTDNVGTAAANLDLSKRRAEAVKAAVAQKLGGGAERFESAGYGAGSPRETNATPEGRARNRRVEMSRMR